MRASPPFLFTCAVSHTRVRVQYLCNQSGSCSTFQQQWEEEEGSSRYAPPFSSAFICECAKIWVREMEEGEGGLAPFAQTFAFSLLDRLVLLRRLYMCISQVIGTSLLPVTYSNINSFPTKRQVAFSHFLQPSQISTESI